MFIFLFLTDLFITNTIDRPCIRSPYISPPPPPLSPSKEYKPRAYSQRFTVNKYKTFSVLIYSYINTSGNWENEKLCGNTTPEGRSVFTQFRVFPISTSVDITIYQYGKNVLYLFYNIAQRNIKKEIFRRFRVDIELYQHGS